ncbi:MAG: dihydroorotase [Saprospiraceae bacterium]
MIFIKNTLVLHPDSSFHRQNVDMIIEGGIIQKIGKSLVVPADAKIISGEGAFISPGFMDLGVQVCDPGFEHREDVFSASAAAEFGGFTAIAIFPNTQPALHSKSELAYIKKRTEGFLVDFKVIGALTRDCKGEEISEMYDMHSSGSIAFSDGQKVMKNGDVMLRALQYVKAFDGLVMNHPFEKSVASGGQMHEGVMSTSLGMKGIPSLSEELMLVRDLYLLEYCDSRLHVFNISTARSVDLIRQAKAKGLKVSASVAAINLAFDDSHVENFETFMKVQPPLRAKSDIVALCIGLKDGTINIISSNHSPQDEEAKNLEFPYAEFGAVGLETAVAVANTYSGLSSEELVDKFAIQPRRIMKLDIPKIEENAAAELTLFHPKLEWTYQAEQIFSKSKNSPFVGKKLLGKAIAVFNQGQGVILP